MGDLVHYPIQSLVQSLVQYLLQYLVQSLAPAGRRQAGGWRRAVAPTPTPLVSTHPPKIAIPLLRGKRPRGHQWGKEG